MASDPICAPFQYILIPCDKSMAPSTYHFKGKTDEELRENIGRYFQQNGISVGQAAEFKEHLHSQVAKHLKGAEEQQDKASEGVLDTMLSSSSTTFEIVPVVYPVASNGYSGTSLYIDQIGAFKELPLNDRASHIAQRPIRGDAFMLRCLDNPTSDEWRRIDCTLADFEELMRHPPSAAPDPTAQAMAMQAEQASQQASKDLTAEEVDDAQEAKDDGNEAFQKQDYKEAMAKYTAALELLSGRCPDYLRPRVAPLLVSCRLNRAQCGLKLEKWAAVVQDCTAVLAIEPSNHKALFRRASALLHQGEFQASYEDLQKAESQGSNSDIAKLMAQVRRAEAEDRKKKQQQFSKMFG